jgi:drug/metabolite transporter (DMT)-like permease
MIVTRMLRDTHDIVLMTSQMSGTFALGAVTTPFAWVTPSRFDMVFLVAIGAISIAAQFSINRSLKLAPASVVVPYQYSMLVWAILFGYIGFGDVPDRYMLAGSAIIVGAGLYIFHREQMVARREPVLASPA